MRVLVTALVLLASFDSLAACLTKYDRKAYPHWRGGSRDAVIAANSFTVLHDDGTTSRKLLGEYTGKLLTVGIDRIDMDHVIPLKWAHENGAKCWDAAARKAFANDPDNMIAVSASANRRKGADLFNFLPSKLAYCKEYLKRIEFVFDKYDFGEVPEDFERATRYCATFEKGVRLNKLTPF